MSHPQVSDTIQWQIIGMREAGIPLSQIGHQVGHYHSTISRIVRKYQLTNASKDIVRYGKLHKRYDRDKNALRWIAR